MYNSVPAGCRIALSYAAAGMVIGCLSVASGITSMFQLGPLVLPLSAAAALTITLLDVFASSQHFRRWHAPPPHGRGRSLAHYVGQYLLVGFVAIAMLAVVTYFVLLMTLLIWLGGA